MVDKITKNFHEQFNNKIYNNNNNNRMEYWDGSDGQAMLDIMR